MGAQYIKRTKEGQKAMIHSKIFEEKTLEVFEKKLLELLNKSEDFYNKRIVSSPRAVGDTVQEIIGEQLLSCFPKNTIKDYNDTFARRAMADLAFYDSDNNYFVIDIKTHNKNTSFNMPNLTSVERLARFYEDDKNFFVILLVEYSIIENKIVFEQVRFLPIENFTWDCLTIGALGWGQIQIANANVINIDRNLTRKYWMLQLCDVLDVFYPKEISKIEKRIDRFAKGRSFWESKES